MNIGLTYDLRDDYLAEGWPDDLTAEFDRADTVDALEEAIRSRGYSTDRIGRAAALMRRLLDGDRWDLVFNIAEGVAGFGRESLVPALLDQHSIPYTFSDPLVCALTLHKGAAKHVLRDRGVPTPDFAVVERPADAALVDMPFPLFVKPVAEGSSKGVERESKVRSRGELERVCARLIERYRQPVIVEAFLPGREFTVGVLGTGERARAVAAMEVVLGPDAEPEIYSYDNKERWEGRIEYRLETGEVGREAERLALRAWRALGCRDGGRVDVRADEGGRLQVLEINPLPGLSPKRSDLPIMCTLRGTSFAELIGAILDSALSAPRRRADARRGAVRTLILHDEVPPGARADEVDTLAQADAVESCLAELGHAVSRAAFTSDRARSEREILARRPDLVFNLVESVDRQGRLIHLAPALLDALGVPYTGCRTAALFVTSGKPLTKELLAAAGFPTPEWLDARALEDDAPVEGAWIVKSAWEHASVGLDESSVVRASSRAQLRTELRARLGAVGGEGFVERYIDGREFNMGVLCGESGPLVLPAAEIAFRNYGPEKPRVVGFRAKWVEASFEYRNTVREYDFPAEDAPLLEELSRLTLACWRIFSLRGHARVDFRVDSAGRPWILEVNANPCLTPGAGFEAAAERAGVGLRDIVSALVRDALRG